MNSTTRVWSKAMVVSSLLAFILLMLGGCGKKEPIVITGEWVCNIERTIDEKILVKQIDESNRAKETRELMRSVKDGTLIIDELAMHFNLPVGKFDVSYTIANKDTDEVSLELKKGKCVLKRFGDASIVMKNGLLENYVWDRVDR